MSNIPILTNVEFFQASYQRMEAKVPPRGFSSLTLRLSGKVLIFTTNGCIESKANMLTLLPAGCAYETKILEPGEMLILHVWTASPEPLFPDGPTAVLLEQTENLAHLFRRGIRHMGAEGVSYSVFADAYRILSEADTIFFQRAPQPPARMEECKRYLDERVCDPDLRVAELATRYGTSEVYFRNAFKKYYRMTPIEYIKQRRIDTACRLLRSQLYSVAEVATRAGFDSISYFSSEFRRKMGASPREYREGE